MNNDILWIWLLRRAKRANVLVKMVSRCPSYLLAEGEYQPHIRTIFLSTICLPLDCFSFAHELAHAELGHKPDGDPYSWQEVDADEYANQLISKFNGVK